MAPGNLLAWNLEVFPIHTVVNTTNVSYTGGTGGIKAEAEHPEHYR